MLTHRLFQPVCPARAWRSSRSGRRSAWLVVLCWALALCTHAAGQKSQPDSAALPRGLEALRQGKLPQAQEFLQTAFQKSYEPRVLCLMGQLAKALGLTVQSYDFYYRCREEGGSTLEAGLKQEALAMVASPPGRSGELLVSSKKGGFLWIAELLTARLRPGETARLTLPVGKHALRLGSGAAFEVTMQQQNVCDVELELQQSSCSKSTLLLPFGPTGPIAISQPRLDAWWAQLATSLKKENGHLLALPRQQALFSQNPQSVRCLTDLSCQVKLGKLADASNVLGVQVDPVPDLLPDAPKRDYRLRAWLVETHVEESIAEEEQVCERCSQAELEQTLGELSRRVFARGQRPVRRVQINSTPSASAVVEGKERGRTPLRIWLLTGAHEVKLQLPYFYASSRRIDVLEDTTEEVQNFTIELRPLPVSRGEKAVRYGAWLSGGLGLAAIATGLGLYFKPDDAVSPQGDQPGYLLSTKNPGIGMLAAGGTMLLTSVILIVVDRYSQSQRRSR